MHAQPGNERASINHPEGFLEEPCDSPAGRFTLSTAYLFHWVRIWADVVKLEYTPFDMTVGFIEGARLTSLLRGYVAQPACQTLRKDHDA